MAEQLITTGYEPRRLQAQLHRNFKRFNVVLAHRRFGKCLDASTIIPTPDGFKAISQIKNGDKVYSSEGSVVDVIGSFDPFEAETYDFVFDSGITINCDKDHFWYVEPALSKVTIRKNREPWKCGDVLAAEDIIKRFRSGEKFFVPTVAAGGENKDLPIDPYWFGYWLGDGCKDYPQIYIADNDPVDFAYTATCIKQKSGCRRVYFGGSDLRQKLASLQVLGSKKIPLIYKTASFEQRMELVRGLMDSDGTVSESGTCVFDNSDERIAKDFLQLIRSCGFKASINEYRHGEYKVLFSCGSNRVFKLDRKHNRVRKNHFKAIRHKLVDIVPKGKRLVKCIMADSPNSLYLASDYLPTHNTVCVINELIHMALQCDKPMPRYAYIAPTYSQAKRVSWDYFKKFTENLPNRKVNEQELRIDIDLSDDNNPERTIRFFLLGADNPDSARGIYLDGVAIDEYADMNPRMWTEVVRPALSDRTGWAIFIGTPKGRNHFYDVYQYAKNPKNEDWHAALYDGEKTGVIPKSELEYLKQTMDEAEYNQEIRCKFEASLVGAYYYKEFVKADKENRITQVPHDLYLPVHTAWDLGLDDYTAIWFFQMYGSKIQVFDYMEDKDNGLDEYCQRLNERKYSYGEHYFPWDVQARDLSTGKTRYQALQKLLRGRIIVVPRQSVEDGIHAVRQLLGKCWFDANKCERGIDALRHYRRKWDQKNQIYTNQPVHNWASHGSDAFRYLAMGIREDKVDEKDLPRQATTEYDIFGI